MFLTIFISWFICLLVGLFQKCIELEFIKMGMRLALLRVKYIIKKNPGCFSCESFEDRSGNRCIVGKFLFKEDISLLAALNKSEAPIEVAWGDITSWTVKCLPRGFWEEVAALAWGYNWNGKILNSRGEAQIKNIERFIKTHHFPPVFEYPVELDAK